MMVIENIQWLVCESVSYFINPEYTPVVLICGTFIILCLIVSLASVWCTYINRPPRYYHTVDCDCVECIEEDLAGCNGKEVYEKRVKMIQEKGGK